MTYRHYLRLLALTLLILLMACASGAPEAQSPAAAADLLPDVAAPSATATIEATPSDEPPATSTSAAATATPEPSMVAAPDVPETEAGPPVEDVTFHGSDGLPIQATLYRPGANLTRPVPGVMLLHMLGSDRQVWAGTGLVDDLTAAGYAVLAVDMRGHGETGGEQDWTQALDDLRRVWQAFAWLDEPNEIDEARTAVIGASIGANMALLTAAAEPTIRTAVLLSPGLDIRGVTLAENMPAFDERLVFIVAGRDDDYPADSAQTLLETAPDVIRLQLYDRAGHGTNMFGSQPELSQLIVDWLNATVGGSG